MTVNSVHLVGNLGADPEVRTANNGTVVANLRLATTERVKRGDNWEDETSWHRVTVFGKTAESVGKYCQKGKQLYIDGRIQYRKYTDKEGVEKWSTEIVARNVRFLGGKGDGGSGGGGGNRGGSSGSSGGGGYGGGGGGNQGGGGGGYDDGDDVPF